MEGSSREPPCSEANDAPTGVTEVIGAGALVMGTGCQLAPAADLPAGADLQGAPATVASAPPRPVRPTRVTLTLADENLLRGVALPQLLWGFGRHFRTRALGSHGFTEAEGAWLFAHSRRVARLQEFLSHSWGDNGLNKYLALCLFYNSLPAALVSFALGLVALALDIAGLIPRYSKHVFETSLGREELYLSFSASTVGIVVYMAALIGWHHTPWWLGGGGNRAVFFDKICVHQTDLELKAAGIQSFAAFIAKADRLLVLWSPEYFGRLWCTLEVAAFVYLQQSKPRPLRASLAFRPLQLACFAWCTITGGLGYIVLSIGTSLVVPLLRSNVVCNVVRASAGLVVIPAALHTLRAYQRDRDTLVTQLEDFAIESASCLSTEDREVIYASVRRWFGSLDAFNEHVKTSVSQYVWRAIPEKGQYPLVYSACVQPTVVLYMLDWFVAFHNFQDTSKGVTHSLRVFLYPVLFDFAIALMLRVSSLAWVKRPRGGAFHGLCINLLSSLLAAVPIALLNLGSRLVCDLGPLASAGYDLLVVACLVAVRGHLDLRRRLLAAGRVARLSVRHRDRKRETREAQE